MRHCTPGELIDVVEGRRAASTLPHLSGCESCREALAAAEDVLTAIRDVDVPEPPPFAMAQLSARVRAAVDAERVPSPIWLSVRSGLNWRAYAAAGALVVALVSVARLWPQGADPSREVVANPSVAEVEDVGGERNEASADTLAPAGTDREASWMMDLAGAVDPALDDGNDAESASVSDLWSFGPVPVSIADTAVDDLSVDEQRELARLIKEAMEGTGA